MIFRIYVKLLSFLNSSFFLLFYYTHPFYKNNLEVPFYGGDTIYTNAHLCGEKKIVIFKLFLIKLSREKWGGWVDKKEFSSHFAIVPFIQVELFFFCFSVCEFRLFTLPPFFYSYPSHNMFTMA